MTVSFKNLTFDIDGEKIVLANVGGYKQRNRHGFLEIQVAGENRPSHAGVKAAYSSEEKHLKYISHTLEENLLCVIQESELIQAKTSFEAFDDTDTVRVYTEVTAKESLVLEQVSSVVIGGISPMGNARSDDVYLTRFFQSHHTECQPRRASLEELGFISDGAQQVSQKKISFANIGSWSTKEALPQCIIENTLGMLMFQIESNASWYYEISDRDGDIYLYLGGADATNGSWSKKLEKGDSYRTYSVALAFGKDLNEAVGEMTKYRRHISTLAPADKNLPTIFNEYMHLSWDCPTEENTRIYAPVVAKTGVEYYVIDCGWHNDEDSRGIYNYVGQWRESHTRFPSSVRATTDFIRSLGMKAGLWIEPEVIGHKCEEMLNYYTDDCFIRRNGKRVFTMGRYFLDYRHPKVIEYMTETIRRMVEDYGAEYIKFDYNQDLGVGGEGDAYSLGEGLELSAHAFIKWVNAMTERFPHVVFEGCASGGMRMDYKTLSAFSLISTSDQIDYLKYPYIAGNILSAVLPEQAAVWSYPVGYCKPEEITDDQIVFNMVNSLLGRMHLASHLEYMTEEQFKLVKEGILVYNSISDFKKTALPYFPCGLTKFGDDTVVAGLKNGSTAYLAAWCIGEKEIRIPIRAKNASVLYPSLPNTEIKVSENEIILSFEREKTAAFIKLEIKE